MLQPSCLEHAQIIITIFIVSFRFAVQRWGTTNLRSRSFLRNSQSPPRLVRTTRFAEPRTTTESAPMRVDPGREGMTTPCCE